MRVWVTRARPGADRTADRLRALGHTPLVDPVMTVRPVPAEIDLTGVTALAFTSVNGLDAFVSRKSDRALPVFAVGDATAEAARNAGFAAVASAGGDVNALGRAIAAAGLPAGAVVLSPGGRERAGDLAAAAGPGVEVRTLALYETAAREPAEALEAMAADGLDAVLVHSPSAARRVAAVCAAWKTGRARFLALSPAVAEPLKAAGFARVEAAPFPDEPSLLNLLGQSPGENEPMTDASSAPHAAHAPRPAPPGAPRRRRGAAIGLAGFLGVGLLAAIAFVLYAPRLKPSPRTAPPSASAPASANTAALRARIAELEAQLASARAAAPTAAAGASVDPAAAAALQARLERLEQAQARSARAASAAIAAAALADAAATSRPFAGELATLERLSPGYNAIAGLRPLAVSGAPTRAALAAEFPDVAARAAAASRARSGETGLVARIGGALSSLFKLRRVDDVSGTGPDAVLARAERRVLDGDLEGALQQLEALPEGGQAATAAWREKARRRVEIERRIADLRALALRDLAAEERR